MVNADCSGTQTLTTTIQGSPPYASTTSFWLVEGGEQEIGIDTDAGVTVTGRAYRAAAAGASACGNGSLIGDYGFQGSGSLSSGAAQSVAGAIVFDGQGGLTFQDLRNPALNVSGNGTYTVASDCTGFATFNLGGGSSANFGFAITASGDVLVMYGTEDGSIFTGMWQPESLSLLLPQVAFGGGWYTALYFTNTTSAAVSFPVTFIADLGTPLIVPALGGSFTQVNIPALGTAIVEAPNTGSLLQGYAAFMMPPGVSGYGVFRQSVAGRPDQEAVVPFATSNASSGTFVWDDATHVTSIAVANAGTAAATISITLWDNNGNVVGTSTLNLPPHQKTEATLRSLPGLSGMVGLRGRG